jgi:hypothetical protein
MESGYRSTLLVQWMEYKFEIPFMLPSTSRMSEAKKNMSFSGKKFPPQEAVSAFQSAIFRLSSLTNVCG